MSTHESELTVVDSPETASSGANVGSAQTGSAPAEKSPAEPISAPSLDPSTELPAPTAEESSARAEATVTRAEFEQMRADRDRLVDRLARMQAEFDNARKRAERERAEFRDFATGNVVEQFLPVLDHFELALKASGSVEQLRSGVELIVKQMGEVLRQLQVTPIAAVGEVFDPRVHEAIGTVEREDIPDQHVAEEIRRGYRFRDRLLRPAMVRVAHNPAQKSE
ncbi:MAG TPA: nucleotide exchange factor GrpE [Lacipirellula sp.]